MGHTFSSPEQQLNAFVEVLLADAASGRFADVRWRPPGGRMQRRFLPASGPAEIASLALRVSPRSDVYVGVAMRDGNAHGGRAAVSTARLAWVESDDPATAERLLGFPCPPSVAVASGTPGHLQLYWLLDRPCGPDQIELANRRLAAALGGDAASADAARVLRFPGTLNHKHDPPLPVRLLACRARPPYSLARLTEGLPSVPVSPRVVRSAVAPRVVRLDVDRELLAIPAAVYARRLTGRSPNLEGKLLCPFHDDSDPSLQLYGDGGFFCFGAHCARGGTIFDFASHLWGIPTRGVGFLELRVRLAKEFGLDAGTAGETLGALPHATGSAVAVAVQR